MVSGRKDRMTSASFHTRKKYSLGLRERKFTYVVQGVVKLTRADLVISTTQRQTRRPMSQPYACPEYTMLRRQTGQNAQILGTLSAGSLIWAFV